MQDDTSLARLMARLSRELLVHEDTQEMLKQITAQTAEVLGRDVMSSVWAVRAHGRIETPACTDARAKRADELQYELGQGPCVVAAIDGDTVAIDDLTEDVTFPDWSSVAARETGLRSVLSLQLSSPDRRLGALNVYSDKPGRFSGQDLAIAWAFATHAAISLRAAQQKEDLLAALKSRTVIGQATGIVMARRQKTPDEAFELLAKIAMDHNWKIHDLAEKVVTIGDIPD